MVKDYTDYLLVILDSGERVYHLVHLRNAKGCKINGNLYPLKEHKYLLNLDRAYRIKWAPWKKIDKNKPWWPLWSIRELVRGKKIGMLLYQERGKESLIETHIIVDCECSCGFKGKTMAGTKIHVKAAGEEHILKNITEAHYEMPMTPIEPMHISRIHQPSGEMKG